MLIGLTGQIGAGKTSAANILKKMGAYIIDADQIGREVVDNTPALRQKLVRAFGDEILDNKGCIKRKKLAALAFSSKQNHITLNKLVHPYLLKNLRLQSSQAVKRYQLVVIDAALLLDWNLDKEMDLVLVIHTSLKERLKRLVKRGITRQDALARLKTQLPFREFQKRADRVILNNGSFSDLERKIQKCLTKNLRQTD